MSPMSARARAGERGLCWRWPRFAGPGGGPPGRTYWGALAGLIGPAASPALTAPHRSQAPGLDTWSPSTRGGGGVGGGRRYRNSCSFWRRTVKKKKFTARYRKVRAGTARRGRRGKKQHHDLIRIQPPPQRFRFDCRPPGLLAPAPPAPGPPAGGGGGGGGTGSGASLYTGCPTGPAGMGTTFPVESCPKAPLQSHSPAQLKLKPRLRRPQGHGRAAGELARPWPLIKPQRKACGNWAGARQRGHQRGEGRDPPPQARQADFRISHHDSGPSVPVISKQTTALGRPRGKR